MPTFAKKTLNFYKSLQTPAKLPSNIETMNPYVEALVMRYVKEFFDKFFNDNKKRVFVFGINPGRFGAGLTGVTFTDPVALENFCKIKNDMDKRREVSSDFIYRFIEHWGGPKKFYRHFFLTAVSPLGFTRNRINYNYYDDKELFKTLRPFIVQTLHDQLAIGARRDVAIVLGTGKNQEAFNALNEEYRFFKKVFFLEHPRFIMQYRRKRIAEYLDKYRRVFSSISL
ncbi:MAG: uracil-DNA glycosylase family protein [Patescibacteria group bacterium]